MFIQFRYKCYEILYTNVIFAAITIRKSTFETSSTSLSLMRARGAYPNTRIRIQVSLPQRPRARSPPPRRHHHCNHKVLELEARRATGKQGTKESKEWPTKEGTTMRRRGAGSDFPGGAQGASESKQNDRHDVSSYSAIGTASIRQREGEAAS